MRCAISPPLSVIVLLAACGGGAKKAADPVGNEVAAVELAGCPSEAELRALAAEVWAPSEEPEDVWCLPLRVQGEARWWIAGYAKTDDPEAYGSSPHEALVEPPRAVIWKDASPWDEMYPDAQEPEAIDLDGDGTDEIVYVSTYGEGGGSSTELVVIGVAGARPVTGKAGLGWSYLDEGGCISEHRIERGVVVITGDGECATFSGRFRWNGTGLVTE